MTNPPVSKRAQELAAEIYRRCTMQDDAEMREWVEGLFEQYGREVRDAAAKAADKIADGELDDYAAGGAYSAAKAIRAMDLP